MELDSRRPIKEAADIAGIKYPRATRIYRDYRRERIVESIQPTQITSQNVQCEQEESIKNVQMIQTGVPPKVRDHIREVDMETKCIRQNLLALQQKGGAGKPSKINVSAMPDSSALLLSIDSDARLRKLLCQQNSAAESTPLNRF